MSNAATTLPTDYSNRLEINTPIALKEKQHCAYILGAWRDVFSYSINGRRKFKYRRTFRNAEEAAQNWITICNNYK